MPEYFSRQTNHQWKQLRLLNWHLLFASWTTYLTFKGPRKFYISKMCFSGSTLWTFYKSNLQKSSRNISRTRYFLCLMYIFVARCVSSFRNFRRFFWEEEGPFGGKSKKNKSGRTLSMIWGRILQKYLRFFTLFLYRICKLH